MLFDNSKPLSINLNVAHLTSVFKVFDLRRTNAFKISMLLMLISTLAFCMAATKTRAATNAIVSITPSSATAGLGQNFNLTIEIDNLQPPNGAFGFQLGITWDPAILKGISITDVLFQNNTPPDSTDNIWAIAHKANDTYATYAYTYQDRDAALSGGYAPIFGNHTLAILTLQGIASGNSPVTFDVVKIGDADANPVPTTAVNATVAVGNAAPLIIISSPANNTAYTTNSVGLIFTINKPTSWIGYSLDGGSNITLSGNSTIQAVDGHHIVIVYANDSAGLMGQATVNFSTDTAPPTVSFTYSPQPPTADYVFGNFRWVINFTAATSNDTGSGISTYYWNFGDGTNATTNQTADWIIHTYRESGPYTVTLNLTDFAGHSAQGTISVTIGSASPPISLPIELILAIVLPVVWIPVLGYYLVRGYRKRKFRKLK